MSRGLLVELLGGIGDLVFCLPALDALVEADPSVAWDVITFDPGAQLLDADPRVRKVFRAPRNLPCAETLATLLSQEHYDVLVSDTRHSGIHLLLEGQPAGRIVTQLWAGARRDEPIPQLFLRRLREEGLIDEQRPDPPARLALTDADRRAAATTWRELRIEPGGSVVVNPHAGMAIKRWPTAAFIHLGRNLSNAGWNVLVLAGDDPGRANEISRAVPRAAVVPRLALRTTAAFLTATVLLVSSDSGLAHVANAVGTPVVGLFGPTWAGRYGIATPARNLQAPFACPELIPLNFTLQRCWYSGQCIFPHLESCCQTISPQAVLQACRELLPDRPSGVTDKEGRCSILAGPPPAA